MRRTINDAKAALAPQKTLSAWQTFNGTDQETLYEIGEVRKGLVVLKTTRQIERQRAECSGATEALSSESEETKTVFEDNCNRLPLSAFVGDEWGDSLPEEPCVLTGCCNGWSAFDEARGGEEHEGIRNRDAGSQNWSIAELAKRLPPESHLFSLDGGPGFARQSMGEARVSMEEYLRYCKAEAAEDAAPLYVFDYRCLEEPVYCTDSEEEEEEEEEEEGEKEEGIWASAALPPPLPAQPRGSLDTPPSTCKASPNHHSQRQPPPSGATHVSQGRPPGTFPPTPPRLRKKRLKLKRGCVFPDTGLAVHREFSVPNCFSRDVMAGLTGSRFRPLPPVWLLVGCKRSGTPIHDHPATVAWNTLLSGCKLWCVLPPGVDEAALLLLPQHEEDGKGGVEQMNEGSKPKTDCEEVGNSDQGDDDDEDDDDFDLSALQWFGRCGGGGGGRHPPGHCDGAQGSLLPSGAVVVVQQPGETVFVPAGWWHVVLNVEPSAALSHSLALRRDLPCVLPALASSPEEHETAFAEAWASALVRDGLLDSARAEALLAEGRSSRASSAETCQNMLLREL